jgi:hypothetical protein
MGIQFSESTIKSGFIVQNPDWYDYEFVKVEKKDTARGDSQNYIIDLEGRSGEMTNVPVTLVIWENADWVLLPIFKAFLGGKDPEPGVDYEVEDLVGTTLSGYTKRGAHYKDGTPQNDISDWRPVGG